MVLFRASNPYDMVKIASVFSLLFVLVCYAQPKEKIINFDFGEVSSKEILSHKFVLKEKVVSAVSMCDCLKINISKEKHKFVVGIELDPEGYEGKVSLEGLLIKDDNNIIRLRISAVVRKD